MKTTFLLLALARLWHKSSAEEESLLEFATVSEFDKEDIWCDTAGVLIGTGFKSMVVMTEATTNISIGSKEVQIDMGTS